MRQLGTWATELEIRALESVLGRRVVIYATHAPDPKVPLNIHFAGDESGASGSSVCAALLSCGCSHTPLYPRSPPPRPQPSADATGGEPAPPLLLSYHGQAHYNLLVPTAP